METSRGPGAPRLFCVDLARSAALLGMVAFHLARDLEMFGLAPAGMTLAGGWATFARLVAGSFLFLSGASLVLAHGRGLRRRAFRRRLARVAGAALLVTAATAAAMPGAFVYFGILHAIALASLAGLAFLGRPWWAAGLAGAGIVLGFLAFGYRLFATPWLGWTGLSAEVRPALDLIPVFPWLGVFLLGMAAARGAGLAGWRRVARGPLLRALAWPGRHSLAVYLLHQPLLLGALWLATRG